MGDFAMMKYTEKEVKKYLKNTAIKSLLKGKGGFHLHADGKVDFIDGSPTATEEEIQAEMSRIQAEYDSEAYARKRVSEYPSISEQLDDIYHNGIDGWKATIKAVKDKYPK